VILEYSLSNKVHILTT